MARAGVAAIEALLRYAGPSDVRAWDADGAAVERLRPGLSRLGVTADAGGDATRLLDASPPVRTIVKSPGIRLDAAPLTAARGRRIAILDEAELGWRLDSRPVVGVTGTNGKSTSAALATQLLRSAGWMPVLAGNTLFGPPLAAATAVQGDVLVAELSSFQLAGCDCLLPDAAVFTNLGFEHWGWHGGERKYGEAKARLFVRGDRAVERCAINVDGSFGRALAEDVKNRGGLVVTFGASVDADFRLLDSAWDLRRSKIRLETPHGEVLLDARLPGVHNALNAAGALALAEALEIDQDTAGAAVSGASLPPGRFEIVDEGQPFDVVVDYAHNADGVTRTAATARTVLAERGAGMLRAVGATLSFYAEPERAALGRALATTVDHLILTTQRVAPDEPPGLPSGLREGAEGGGAEVEVVTDRRAAIDRVICSARPDDLVLVLGRGALDGVLFEPNGSSEPFDDRAQARASLRDIGFAAGE